MTAPYEQITSIDELKQFIQHDTPVWLFKHSEACGTSFYAINEYQTYLEAHPDDRAGIIIIQSHRDVSNAAADVLGVIHKSPQLFLVKNGEVLYTTSHMAITVKAMETAMAAAAAT